VITHAHQDHVLFETLLQIRHRSRTSSVPRSGADSCKIHRSSLLLEHCGFRNVIEATEMEESNIGNVRITALPFFGEHADLDIRSKMAWLVNIGPHSMIFAADSAISSRAV